MPRFRYLRFDKNNLKLLNEFRSHYGIIEKVASKSFKKDSEAMKNAMARLKESYCWVAEAIKENQEEEYERLAEESKKSRDKTSKNTPQK